MPQSHITVEWTLVEAEAARKRCHNRSAATVVSDKYTLLGWRWWVSLVFGLARCRYDNRR